MIKCDIKVCNVIYSELWKTTLITENKEWYSMVSAFWHTARFCFRTTPIPHPHNWLTKWSYLYLENICLWYDYFSKVFNKDKSRKDLSQMIIFTAQKTKLSIKDLSKCDQIRRKLRICSHLLKKSFMENFIFCAAIPIWSWMIVLLNCVTLCKLS